MESEIKIYPRPGGQLQRVQVVRVQTWEQLEFLELRYAPDALDCFARIYEQYLVPACPWLFGNMILFRIPEGVETEFPMEGKYGQLADPLTAAAAALKEGVRFRREKPVFQNEKLRGFWHMLEARNCLRVVRGRLPVTVVIPVGKLPGFLSQTQTAAQLRVNASFFIMDRFDCATVYDHVGTPLGLRVKDGVVEAPPLYGREALLVKKDGTVSVEQPDIRELELRIGSNQYRHGRNATVYTRPRYARAPRGSVQLVIVGCRVAAVCRGGGAWVPASGFVLQVDSTDAVPGDAVTFLGLEDVKFGVQVGNSILRNGEKTQHFISKFYNLRHLQPVPYPPSLYPMDFAGARAARIALGADTQGRPMLLWAEGAAKQGFVPGQDSVGATLLEMAQLCADAGMVNAVNLDGGGSAQLLLGKKRSLCISDRTADGTEAERPIPLAIMVRNS